jgi:DNA-binding winged helix-turn-helix (wHTH) protein/tetratricopeptide (TPR) repeat protein
MSDRPVRGYMFGDFLLEPSEGRLSRISDSPVDLTGKPIEVLLHLVENHGRLVSRDELKDKVWPGIHGSDESITEAISRIRTALGSEAYIQTVRGRGYRFVAPVSVVDTPLPSPGDPAEHPPIDTVLPSKGRRHFAIAAGAVLCLAAVGLGLVRFRVPSQKKPKTPIERALQLRLEGNDNLAIRTLLDVPRTDSAFTQARLEAIWLLYDQDLNDKAKPILDQLAPIDGSKPLSKSTGYKIEGLKYAVNDQLDKALDEFQMASHSDPTDIGTLVWVANTATRIGDHSAARGALDTCEKLARLDPDCGYERIDALNREGRFGGAIEEYDLLKRNSTYPWLEQPAGYAELAQGHYDAALQHFNAVKAGGPALSHLHYLAAQDGIAAVHILKGNILKAQQELRDAMKAAESDYERADYQILIAEISAFHGKANDAKKELQEASTQANSTAFEIEAAKIYAIAGDNLAARDRLAKLNGSAQDLGLEYNAAFPFIDGLESLKKGDYQAAADRLADSFEMNKDPETAYFQAKAAMGLNDWTAAIAHFNVVLSSRAEILIDSLPSIIPLAEYGLATCYRHARNEPAAREHLANAQAMWKDADPNLKAQFVGW